MFRMLCPLVLASESPRRKSLLLLAGLVFTTHPSRIDEPAPPDGRFGPEGPAATAKDCARLKAEFVSRAHPGAWVLGADTIVVVKDRIFGKPADTSAAVGMLETLSGRDHEVITGLCLVRKGEGKDVARTGSVVTRVSFKTLSKGEIEAYVKTGEPLDKAGAYGIQGAGAFLARSVHGSYTNVVGLPLCEVIDWLLGENIIAPA
ncbi:MAG: Maf family protein [Syntrophobacteraceae bacterium]|nr:Maf family protein [Syntrophobacteraceae bacterium]